MSRILKVLEHPIVRLLCGIIIFIATWLTIDYTDFVQKILKIAKIDNNINSYLILIDILFKMILSFLLLSLFVFTYIIIFQPLTRKNKRYSEKDILEFIAGEKITINEITIFGYSLTFARHMREYLSKESNINTNVTIIVPSHNIIKNKLSDEQPVQSRLETLNGRIFEWNKLKDERRINNLRLVYTTEIPLENGFLINEQYLFLWYYRWQYVNSKFVQQKNALNNRDFYLIKKEDDPNYFNYFYYRLMIKAACEDMAEIFN